MTAPKSGAQRQSEYAAKGKAIACVIRDHKAIASLERLIKAHGGVTAAITFALHAAASRGKQASK